MKATGLALILAGLASTASAADIAAMARDYVGTHMTAWSSDPVLVAAVLAQNAANAGLDDAQILALDTSWRGEVGRADQPVIKAVLGAPASELLRGLVSASNGKVAEMFVMDNLGLNVATAAITSDYWQGDEAKFTSTFPLGSGAMHASEVDFDESSQQYVIQISFSVSDPATGTPIGAMTVALNAEALN